MPAHPVSRLVRFTLAVGTNVIFDHLGYRRPTVHPVRMIEAVELVACHVFNLAEQTRQSGPTATSRVTWPSWPLIPATVAVAAAGWRRGDSAPRLCDRQRLAASGACDQGACDALIDVIVVRAEVRRSRQVRRLGRPEPEHQSVRVTERRARPLPGWNG